VPEFLRIATAVVALALAAWAGFAAWRDRAPGRGLLVGVLVLEAFALALVGTALARLAGGGRAHEMATFIGYIAAFLVVPPIGLLLARAEPTRWGSLIVVVAGLVEAILVVRLQQVWTGV